MRTVVSEVRNGRGSNREEVNVIKSTSSKSEMQLTEKYPRRNCCITHDTNYPTAAKLSQRTIQTGKASRTNAKPWCGYCC